MSARRLIYPSFVCDQLWFSIVWMNTNVVFNMHLRIDVCVLRATFPCGQHIALRVIFKLEMARVRSYARVLFQNFTTLLRCVVVTFLVMAIARSIAKIR